MFILYILEKLFCFFLVITNIADTDYVSLILTMYLSYEHAIDYCMHRILFVSLQFYVNPWTSVKHSNWFVWVCCYWEELSGCRVEQGLWHKGQNSKTKSLQQSASRGARWEQKQSFFYDVQAKLQVRVAEARIKRVMTLTRLIICDHSSRNSERGGLSSKSGTEFA